MKTNRLISMVLVFVILFSSFSVLVEAEDEAKELDLKVAYDSGYKLGQEDKKTKNDIPASSEISGYFKKIYTYEITNEAEAKEAFLDGYIKGFIEGTRTYGKELGSKLGAVDGESDFRSGKSSNWEASYPTENLIINMYNLEVETEKYRSTFLKDFKEGYQEAYLIAFEDANLKPYLSATERGKSDGSALGGSVGSFFGEKDANEGIMLKYERHLPSDQAIIRNYNLNKDTKEYREAFITNFKIAFRTSYEKSYRESNILNANKKAIEDGKAAGYKDGEAKGKDNASQNKFIVFDKTMINERNIEEHLKGKDSIYKNYFKEGYYEGFKSGYDNIMMTNEEARASAYSISLGSALGEVHGERDFNLDKKSSEWIKSIPSDENIKNMYNLDGESVAYRRRFLQDFKTAYEEAYLRAYDDAKFKSPTGSGEKGKADGSSIGSSIGSFFGEKDANEGIMLKHERHLPSDQAIIRNYNLNKDTKEYREAFITNFKIAFREAYEQSYRDTNIDKIDGEARREGKNKGLEDGRTLGEEHKKANILKPYAMIKPSEEEVRKKNAQLLSGKDEMYIKDFLEGYFEGFKEGYESLIGDQASIQEGYAKGYADGKALAIENNENKSFKAYEDVKPSDNKIITNNYKILEDKSQEYILLFVEGYQKGFEEGYKELIKAGEEPETPDAISAGFGSSFGMTYGEMAGIRDYQNGTRPDFYRAMPRRSEIESMFNLRALPYHERSEFIQQFEASFEIGYNKGYYNTHFGDIKNNMDSGRTDGETFGAMLGKVFGAKDYFEGRSSNFKKDMPSERTITDEYSLNKNNKDYTLGFINGFKNAYEDAYIESFREARNNIKQLEDSSAYENGSAVGTNKGAIQASMDHMLKKTNSWERSQPLSSAIIAEYNLTYQTVKYRDGFLNGFWEGYATGYTETYKQLSQEGAMAKTTSETIPIAGATLESLGGGFAVEINSGIYYKPVILTIDNLSDSYSIESRYISASNFYRLSMINPSGAHAKDKKIKISFEYYGDKDGGIYILDNGKWHYLNSTVEEGIISAYISPASLSTAGNVFGVLVDTETQIFYDIRGHWAKDEITAYIRNRVINGYPDKTFKPDRPITRAEFLILLSRQYRWYMPYDTSNIEFFRDHGTFNRYNIKHLSYALNKNYIIGYPDKYFRPYNHISYKEVDIIMKKILRDPSFKWSDYAQKMMYDKSIRSSSYDSYNNNITRAEFSYMLYNLYQWKY